MKSSLSYENAFSLVELSIVLVILGLLTGGILTGQNLIRAAELRSVTTELDLYNTALGTFKSKYMALPGDMPNATQFWGTDSDGCPTHSNHVKKKETCNGDGNGNIDGGLGPEQFRMWQHFANAQLIQGEYTGVIGPGWLDYNGGINCPESKLTGGAYGIQHNNAWAAGDINWFPIERAGHIMMFGADFGPDRSVAPIIKSEEAWNIDKKLDDGKPGKGKVKGWRIGGNVNPACTTSTDAELAEYDFNNTGIACSLIFSMSY